MNQTRPRGRPRSYDPDRALAGALDTFWDNGFAATSLDMLSDVTAMKRPSLYAAFGDKQEIYLKALARYHGVVRESFAGALERDGPVREALAGYLAAAIDLYTSTAAKPRGCFTVCTAAVEAPNNPAIRAALAAALDRGDSSIERRLRRAKAAGELAEGVEPLAVARLFAAVLHSLAIRARAGASRRQLQAMARQAVRQLLPVADG
jgi:AcrR family transcriptional regulator